MLARLDGRVRPFSQKKSPAMETAGLSEAFQCALRVSGGLGTVSRLGRVSECLLLRGGFNRSAQHLLILRDEEVCHGDIADLVHGSAEDRAVGAMEERAKCCGDRAGAGKTGVERIAVLHGGIGPAPRRRAFAALRLEEREEISRDIAVGRSIRQIAQSLGRAPSTVSREIRRNGGSQAYRANRADRRAWERALRPKPCRLAQRRELRWRVAQKLALQWSPEQISGWLKQEFPTHQDMQISHEGDYRNFCV